MKFKKIITLLFMVFTINVMAQCWSKITTGPYFHTLAIKTDGTLWAWGWNSYGQLGDGTTIDNFIPTQIGTDNNWDQINVSGGSSFGIKTDGTLWAWGANFNGWLGDGTTINRTIPTQIGIDNNWAKISAGDDGYTIAIKTDGTLWNWGYTASGGIIFPTQLGTANNWAQISSGYEHTIAIKTDGTLWAWGKNDFGQLGDSAIFFSNFNFTLNNFIPTQIGSANNWSQIFTGVYHSIATKTDSTLWAWGLNDYGQLGDGTTIDKTTPTQIGTASNWAQLSGGYNHTIGIKTDGTLWAWGWNTYGQLGDGTTIDKTIPTQIGTSNNWANNFGKISVGHNVNFAIKTDGTLWNWPTQAPPAPQIPALITTNCSIVGLNDYALDNFIAVYPNPNTGKFTIKDEENMIKLIEIYNLIGEKITPTFFSSEPKNITVDISNYTNGIYFIKLFNEQGLILKTEKLIKE